MNRCFGRTSKTVETLINSLLSLFVCCLSSRKEEIGESVTHGKWAVRTLVEKWEV